LSDIYIGMETKICFSCHESKNLSEFYFKKDISKYTSSCKLCHNKKGKKWKDNNLEKNKSNHQKYYQENKERLNAINRINNRDHYRKTIEYQKVRSKIYREKNKEAIKARRRDDIKLKRKNNPVFRLKSNVSRTIRRILKNNGSTKNGKSIVKYLGYTLKALNIHLEKQFESWMTQDNYGYYRPKTWNDNDQTTWTWQIDHIIPQSDLPYYSMEDDNFKKCWALENLRPLSSKQNFLDGIQRTRHKKKEK
jgi:hypothetical protein